MRRPRDVAIRASLYVAVALSGFATAYVLKQWLPHWWDARDDGPDDKTSPQQDQSPTDPEAPVTDTPPAPAPNSETPTPSTRTLPPLRTHSLPPPLPNGHAILSLSINPDTMTSPTPFAGSFGEDGVDEEGASQTNTSDTDSFVHVLSPAPTHVISRRRSVRAHDLFATSHISFSELGSLVAPQDEPR